MELVDVEKPIHIMKELYCKVEDPEDSIREKIYEELEDFFERMNEQMMVSLAWNNNSSPVTLVLDNPFYYVRRSLEHVLLSLVNPEELEEIDEVSEQSKLVFTFNAVPDDKERISLRGFTIDFVNNLDRDHRQYIGYIGFNEANAEISLFDFVNAIIGLYIPLRILRDVWDVHEITDDIIYDKVTLLHEPKTCFISLQEHDRLFTNGRYIN